MRSDGGNYAIPAQFDVAKLLTDLLGHTRNFSRAQGNAELDPAIADVPTPYVQYSQDFSTGAAFVINGTYGRNGDSQFLGSWLVRSAPVNAVPGPGQFALLIFGLAGLGLARRLGHIGT